jgi:PAS domain S-box-containing protein
MHIEIPVFSLLLFLSAVVTLVASSFVWKRRSTPNVKPLLIAAAAIAEWSICYGMELGSDARGLVIFWAKLGYLGIEFSVLSFLVFAIGYTGHSKWLSKRVLILLSIVPVIAVLLVFTNDLHGLYWRDIRIETDGLVSRMVFERAPLYWVNVAYLYAANIVFSALMLDAAIRSLKLYRRQAVVLISAIGVPWVANFLYMSGSAPLDYTPFAMSFSTLAIMWGVFRHHLLDVMPVASSAVIDHISDAILVTDPHYKLINANRASKKLIGRIDPGIVGQPVEKLLSRYPNLVSLYDDRREKQVVIAAGRENSRPYFDVNIAPIRDQADQVTAWLTIIRDVTQQTEASLERERLIEELDAFSHTVAHDLKNPLSVISAYAELLEDRFDTLEAERRSRYLSRIQETASKMNGIIEALLLLASIRDLSGHTLDYVNMGKLVKEMLSDMDSLIQERQAEIDLIDVDDWPRVMGYKPWLEGVWNNYISNALKYGAELGECPRIQIGATQLDDRLVKYWVKDCGPGLDAESASQLFTPFTRFNQTAAAGHGLGLSIVKRIIEKLGGRVDVESQPGQGSTFSFTLYAIPKTLNKTEVD